MILRVKSVSHGFPWSHILIQSSGMLERTVCNKEDREYVWLWWWVIENVEWRVTYVRWWDVRLNQLEKDKAKWWRSRLCGRGVLRRRGQREIFVGSTAVHSARGWRRCPKALTGFWLDASHVSLAAGRWREKEEKERWKREPRQCRPVPRL